MDSELMPSPTQLSDLLQRLRNEAGLSMFELAKRSGVNRSTLTRIEAGSTTQPDTGTLNALARFFGVEPELFYDAVWQEAEQPLPSPAVYLRVKYHMSPKQIAQIEESIRTVTGKKPSKSKQPRNVKDNERRSP